MVSKYEDPTTWRLKTGGTGVPYRIVSMSGVIEAADSSASITMLVPSDKLMQFAEEMFPESYMLGTFPIQPSPGRIYGTPLFAGRIAWKGHVDGKPVDPFGVDPTAPDETYQPICECTVDFTTKQDQEESDPNDPFTFLTVSCSGAGEFIHTTAPKAKWTDSDILGAALEPNKLQTTPVSFIVPEVDWDVSWPQVPNVFYRNTLVARLRAALGKVNSKVIPLFFNAPPETILFVGYSLRTSYTWRTATQPPFQMNLKFLEKHVIDDAGKVRGHNDFWKADVGWQRLLFDGVNPVYKSTDLLTIFKS